MYHWGQHQGAECDLLLERDGKFYPIEIKLNSQPTKKDIRGMELFRQKHPHLSIQKGLVIAPVEEVFALSDNVNVIPFDIF